MIRPYTDADLDEVLDVWYSASRQAHSFLTVDVLTSERQQIVDVWLPASETWVFERDGRVVGSVSMLGHEVGGLFVTPAHQGCGVGRALMDHVSASRPYLELGVFEDNPIGRRFYEAYGFRTVGRRIDEATGQPELRLRLGQPPS